MSNNKITLAGYEVQEEIYQSKQTVIYRGINLAQQEPVIIKVPKAQNPTFNQLIKFRNQYNIVKNLNIEGIVKHLSLENYHHSFALVLEDFGGISLENYAIRARKNKSSLLPWPDFFTIAISIATTLESLYQQGIIHKDIKPHNILINPQTKVVKLTDFSISTVLLKESKQACNPNVLSGTLAYMSPEQTGRMNRKLDYRTDFYSLGITLYQLLIGQLPFQEREPLELVHCHLARTATPAQELIPAIPITLSNIIMKLIAKTPEERYQTAFGIRYDLEKCWQQWQKNQSFIPFSLGEGDIPDRFLVPEKLYGRQKEVDSLLKAFQRIAGLNHDFLLPTREMILITGSSGLGKSALVQEIHKPIVQQKGYFINGKCDQFKRNIPFFAIVQALRDLTQQLLTENNEVIKNWKDKIVAALGEQGKAIIEVIPELEILIGEQPILPLISPEESQNRFNALFLKFINIFAQPNHPLVIFIDDLQWVDTASLELIKLLMGAIHSHQENVVTNLLLLGAYRPEEVDSNDPLAISLEEIIQGEVKVSKITLNPLTKNNINDLIADTLNLPPQQTNSLTDLVYRKTKGNPFFTAQLLQSLHQEGLIKFVIGQGWHWNIAQINSFTIDENVVDFMAKKLAKLPKQSQVCLQLAACLGNKFDLGTLACIAQQNIIEVSKSLWPALQAEFIIPLRETYQLYSKDKGEESYFTPQLKVGETEIPYKFIHDRVQQAAYLLISESERAKTHWSIGQLLLQNTPKGQRAKKIFNLVNHLNLGKGLIVQDNQAKGLAELNLQAGQKALTATAYKSAIRYGKIGLSLLGENSWHKSYKSTLKLHELVIESTCLRGDFNQGLELIKEVQIQAKAILDIIEVSKIKIQAYISQNLLSEAIDTALEILSMLGINFSRNPQKSDIQEAIKITQTNLANVDNIEELANLPKMTDAKSLGAMKILATVASATYSACPSLLPLVICKQVDLSIQHGNSELSAFAYATYGLILCGIVRDITTGGIFGQLALSLIQKRKNSGKANQAKIFLVVNSFIKPWQEHIKETLLPLDLAYKSGVETGDFDFAARSLLVHSYHSYFLGKELSEVEQVMSKASQNIKKIKQETALARNELYRQAVLNLMTSSMDKKELPYQLIGAAYNEKNMLPLHQDSSDRYGIFNLYLHKLILAYLWQDYQVAKDNVTLAMDYVQSAAGSLNIAIFYFYYSLTLLAWARDKSDLVIEKSLWQVEQNQEKMKYWSDYAPTNYQHKSDLVDAEKYRLLGDKLAAMEAYDSSIIGSQKSAYLNEEALGNELAAQFYFSWDKEKIAQAYLTDAYYCYLRWGAQAKVEHLQKNYPQLLRNLNTEGENSHRESNINETLSTTLSTGKSLDLEAVIKASLAISGEIRLDNLLTNLIKITLENAGAEKCLFFLNQEEELLFLAKGEFSPAQENDLNIKIPSPIPIKSSSEFPQAILNYVKHTQEILVLDNATLSSDFAADIYIVKQKPKSVLCIPIINQSQLSAIAYLENNLTTSAFTNERVEILRLLASQAAISLENALLYTSVEQKVQERTKEIEIKNQHLEQTLYKLQSTQDQLIQTEKMSSLGQIVAGVAHEINNPVSFIYGNVGYANQYLEELVDLIKIYQGAYPTPKIQVQERIEEIDLDFLIEDLKKLLKSMHMGAERIRNIVLSLRNFSRLDQAQMIAVDIHEGIDNTLLILQHRFTKNKRNLNINLRKNYGKLPPITCYASQLNQVFMNLISNSIDALEESFEQIENQLPQITITTKLANEQVIIAIADNGPGISQKVQERIFDPFFTTKPVGSGTGLGLSISFQIIVNKHKGQLDCISQVGEGTEFMIKIPVTPS